MNKFKAIIENVVFPLANTSKSRSQVLLYFQKVFRFITLMISYRLDMVVNASQITPLFGPMRNRCFAIDCHCHPFVSDILGKAFPFRLASYAQHL